MHGLRGSCCTCWCRARARVRQQQASRDRRVAMVVGGANVVLLGEEQDTYLEHLVMHSLVRGVCEVGRVQRHAVASLSAPREGVALAAVGGGRRAALQSTRRGARAVGELDRGELRRRRDRHAEGGHRRAVALGGGGRRAGVAAGGRRPRLPGHRAAPAHVAKLRRRLEASGADCMQPTGVTDRLHVTAAAATCTHQNNWNRSNEHIGSGALRQAAAVRGRQRTW